MEVYHTKELESHTSATLGGSYGIHLEALTLRATVDPWASTLTMTSNKLLVSDNRAMSVDRGHE